MSQTHRTLLVTGAAGHLGHRTVELLLEAGGDRVVAGSRSPAKLADLVARGAEARAVDFDHPATLDAAFAGVDRLLLVSTDALDRPGRRIEQHRAAIAAAVRAGVRHIVYTSLTKPDASSPILIAADHRETEAALAASGVPHTILRNNMYAEMLLGSAPRAVATGELVSATGEGTIGYVTREDCARAAVAALRASTDQSRTLDVTGPAPIAHAELAALLSSITGRPVKHVRVPLDALEQGMVAAGLPAPVAKVYASFDAGVAQGYMAVATKDVEQLTGHAPRALADFLREHRAALGA